MKKILRRRYAAVGAPHNPLTRMTPPRRSEQNGFELEFEPSFWEILADLGADTRLKKKLVG